MCPHFRQLLYLWDIFEEKDGKTGNTIWSIKIETEMHWSIFFQKCHQSCHQSCFVSGYHVDTPITIKAEPSDQPAVRQIAI